jgi:hypothetical protein
LTHLSQCDPQKSFCYRSVNQNQGHQHARDHYYRQWQIKITPVCNPTSWTYISQLSSHSSFYNTNLADGLSHPETFDSHQCCYDACIISQWLPWGTPDSKSFQTNKSRSKISSDNLIFELTYPITVRDSLHWKPLKSLYVPHWPGPGPLKTKLENSTKLVTVERPPMKPCCSCSDWWLNNRGDHVRNYLHKKFRDRRYNRYSTIVQNISFWTTLEQRDDVGLLLNAWKGSNDKLNIQTSSFFL